MIVITGYDIDCEILVALQIQQLTEETEKLKSDLKEAPELKNVPNKVIALAQVCKTHFTIFLHPYNFILCILIIISC